MAIYYGNELVSINNIKEKNVYVEVPEGSTIDDMTDDNTIAISPEQYAALADAASYRVGDYVERTVAQMITDMKTKYLQNKYFNMFTNLNNTSWVRPQNWPDLDSLNLQMDGDDFIYMTYDNISKRGAIALHIEKISNGQNINVTIGRVSNGTYTPIETITGSSNNYVRWFTNQDDDYPVVRITGDISLCYSYSVTSNGITQHYRRQPIIERIAYIPHLTKFCTSYSSNAWGQFTLQREKVNNGDGTALTSLYYAWAYCRELRDLDINGLKTQNVTSLDNTFAQCTKLKELDLRHFDVKKVTTINSLVNSCRALRSIDLRGWDTSKVTTMSNTFNACWNLMEIKGLEDFTTSAVTTFSSLFANCWAIHKLNIESWNASNITTLYACFTNCYSLEELDLSHWNVAKVTNLSSVFTGCNSLTRVNLNGWSTGTLTTVYSLFSGCWSLQKIDVSWLHLTSSCTDMCYLFSNCWSVKELNIPSDWNISGLSSNNNCAHSIFNNCYALEHITGISGWRHQVNNSIANMFTNCYNLRELNISNWTVNTVTNMASMFNGCFGLTSLDLSNWNPANCTSFSSMFNHCDSLTTVGNISGWNTSKCTNMSAMFRYCRALKEIPAIQNWDLSQVTTLDSMFSECTALESVTWTNVNLPVCTNIAQIFRYDYNLKYADLREWNVPSVTNSTSYYHTLGDCHTLQDVIGFPIPTTYTNIGFQNCENLSYTSLMTIINALPQVTGTHTLRIPAISLNLLSTEEKAIATNKNWTLANS